MNQKRLDDLASEFKTALDAQLACDYGCEFRLPQPGGRGADLPAPPWPAFPCFLSGERRGVGERSGRIPDYLAEIETLLREQLCSAMRFDRRCQGARVPLDTLKIVVDLAVEIGREGREGKPVGTLFVVGDSRKVMASSRPTGFDPVRGYSRKERNLDDARVREGIKEIAQMDGAIVVSSDGVVEAACRYLDCSAADVTLSKGLGARHWAAAAISRATNAVAVTVSQSNGTVCIFQNGEVVLRIEPYLRRPMVWREFEYEPPVPEARPKPKADGAA